MRKTAFVALLAMSLLHTNQLFSQTNLHQPFTRKAAGYLSFIIPWVTILGSTLKNSAFQSENQFK